MTCERFLSKNLIVNLPAPYRRERLLQQCASFVPPFSFIFQLNTNYILSIGNKIPFAHSLPAEEEEQERSIFLWHSRIRRMRVNQNPDFPGSARHVILTVKGAAENRSSFAVGGLRGPRREAWRKIMIWYGIWNHDFLAERNAPGVLWLLS